MFYLKTIDKKLIYNSYKAFDNDILLYICKQNYRVIIFTSFLHLSFAFKTIFHINKNIAIFLLAYFTYLHIFAIQINT